MGLAKKEMGASVTIQATGAISWRKEGIKYRKNELFIDVVEHCNLMMSSQGTVLRNDVSGVILVKCYLSGTPECKFGLNDKLLLDNEAKVKKTNMRRPGSGIEIDDCSFHQCVKLGKFDMDRTISFVPPDGEFQLMQYRITENVNLPFRVLPVVKELGRTRLEINVKIKSMFTFKLFAASGLHVRFLKVFEKSNYQTIKWVRYITKA